MSQHVNKDRATYVVAGSAPDASKNNWTAQKLPYNGVNAVPFDAGTTDSQGLPVASFLVPGTSLDSAAAVAAAGFTYEDVWR